MSTLSEIIVLLWLLPALINIILPLGILAIWLVLRLLGFARNSAVIGEDAAARHAY